jgi:hypothetical protein
MVVWAVKADRRAVPNDLAAALASRADIVVFSRGETEFVAEAFAAAGAPRRPRPRIETPGRDQSRWRARYCSRHASRGRRFDRRRRYIPWRLRCGPCLRRTAARRRDRRRSGGARVVGGSNRK